MQIKFKIFGSGTMRKKILNSTSARLLGLMAFIGTGGGLILSTAINDRNFYKTEILIIYGGLFAISLVDHYRKLNRLNTNKVIIDKNDFKRILHILLCSFVGVTLTWFINHQMGYGPVIANGLVGVMAATFLPNDLAGITYTSSFVGMSSLEVIPSLGVAVLGSIIVGIIFLITAEIYSGIGGKGGTTASLSTIITKTIVRIFT